MNPANFNAHPVYQKSLVLKDLSSAVATYFAYDGDFFNLKRTSALRDDIAYSLMTDANLITSTFEQAYLAESDAVRNKSAKFINIMTRNIWSYCNGLEHDGVKEREYLNLLRREIKLFRAAFKQWRKSLK
ncbi:MAG: hypothetical protein HKP24_09575 [Croceitalea sp.]|nr:hypothetical protein [Croceitalea sp.]